MLEKKLYFILSILTVYDISGVNYEVKEII